MTIMASCELSIVLKVPHVTHAGMHYMHNLKARRHKFAQGAYSQQEDLHKVKGGHAINA